MKTTSRQLFLGAAVACFFTLTLAALSQEEKKPSTPPAAPAAVEQTAPPTPAAPEIPAAPAPAAVTEPAAAASPAVTTTEENKEPELRRLDNEPAKSPDRKTVPPARPRC